MHKIFCLLSCETIVLIAALFLFAYVKKNELGKWLQYAAASIAIFIMVIMIGSVFTCCMPCYGNHGGCGGSKNQCSYNKGGDDDCCKKNMNWSKGGKEDCCSKGNMDRCEMGEDKEIRIEIDGDGKDTVQKKVIIQRQGN